MFRNRGVRKPRRMLWIWTGVSAASWLAVAWGAFEIWRTGTEDGLPHVAVGVGLVPGIIGVGMALLSLRTVRIVAAAQRGAEVIAHWVVSAEELASFAAADKARNAFGDAYSNDWIPPKTIPPEGIEIRFVADGVLVGDTYFGLVNTGMMKFEGVQILPGNPLAIEFGTVLTSVSKVNAVRVHTARHVLRLPIARLARDDAARLLQHYQRVDRREIVVNPGFYRGRVKFGLIAAAVCGAVSAIGFAMGALDIGGGEVPVVLAVVDFMFALGGLILAAIARVLSASQHQRRG